MNLLAIILAVLFSGCRPDVSSDVQHVDIRGRVTGIIGASEEMRGRALAGFIRVEGTREPDTGYDAAAITITDTTIIILVRDGSRSTARFESIVQGDSIDAAFTGPVLESYPPQVTARRITIHR